MAWEAQLSPITLDDIAARTDRYVDEGIRVCWVSPHEQTPQAISCPAEPVGAAAPDGPAAGLPFFPDPSESESEPDEQPANSRQASSSGGTARRMEPMTSPHEGVALGHMLPRSRTVLPRTAGHEGAGTRRRWTADPTRRLRGSTSCGRGRWLCPFFGLWSTSCGGLTDGDVSGMW